MMRIGLLRIGASAMMLASQLERDPGALLSSISYHLPGV